VPVQVISEQSEQSSEVAHVIAVQLCVWQWSEAVRSWLRWGRAERLPLLPTRSLLTALHCCPPHSCNHTHGAHSTLTRPSTLCIPTSVRSLGNWNGQARDDGSRRRPGDGFTFASQKFSRDAQSSKLMAECSGTAERQAEDNGGGEDRTEG